MLGLIVIPLSLIFLALAALNVPGHPRFNFFAAGMFFSSLSRIGLERTSRRCTSRACSRAGREWCRDTYNRRYRDGGSRRGGSYYLHRRPDR